jgi:hypothetical protein
MIDRNLFGYNQPQVLIGQCLCQAVQRWQQVPGLNSLGVVHPTLADGATPRDEDLSQITPSPCFKYDQTPL